MSQAPNKSQDRWDELTDHERGAAFLALVAAHAEALPPARVTHQSGKGFKKCIGTYLHSDGKPRPKIFWLGHDEFLARRMANFIAAIHHCTTNAGETPWQDDVLQQVPRMVEALRGLRDRQKKSISTYLERIGLPPLSLSKSPSSPSVPQPESQSRIEEKAAIWPPTPLLDEAVPAGSLGHAAGNIYWFNRILAAFLSRTANAHAADSGEPADAGDEEDAGKGRREAVPEEEDADEIARAARRQWGQASDAMNRMRNRLYELEITKANAQRIWGPAVLVFLVVLRTAHRIRHRAALRESVPSTTSLARTWLAMLLTDRDQGDDYASSADSPYDGQFFPSVAWDLLRNHKVSPGPERLAIICVAYAHALAQGHAEKHPISMVQWLILRDATNDLSGEVFRDEAHLAHLWQAYFQDPGEPVTWDLVRAALGDMQRATWRDHPGVRDLMTLEQFRASGGRDEAAGLSEALRRRLSVYRSGGYRSLEISRFLESCGNARCARFGIETAEMRGLRELKPMICPACGSLLIPDLLADAFRRLSDGRAS